MMKVHNTKGKKKTKNGAGGWTESKKPDRKAISPKMKLQPIKCHPQNSRRIKMMELYHQHVEGKKAYTKSCTLNEVYISSIIYKDSFQTNKLREFATNGLSTGNF